MTPTDPQAPAAPAAPAAAAPAVDMTDYQRQIDELKEQVAESQRTAQFWAQKAANGAPAAPAAPKTDDGDDDDVLEAITTGGAKGFDALAAKRGFVRRNEVEELIETRATTLTKEQQLITEYPDLQKKNSEFFKATAINYGNLVKSGTPQPVAMELAAKQTELEFIRAGKIKMNGSGPSGEEKEAARLRRIAAQASPNGSSRPAPSDEEDEELTPQQKHIADAMGITHEAYAKRAKGGVAMRGVK
jgi:hypothetical protein